MYVNVEQIHSLWCDNMVEFSLRHMAQKYGRGICRAAIIESIIDSNNSYRAKHVFNLPYGSDKLIFHMARFAHCTLSDPDEVEGLDLVAFPYSLFCLQSILLASFPKNVVTGYFRAHNGALSAGDSDDPDTANRAENVAFSGLGIILMNTCRQAFFPLASDAEVVRMTDQYFLCILAKNKKGKND